VDAGGAFTRWCPGRDGSATDSGWSPNKDCPYLETPLPSCILEQEHKAQAQPIYPKRTFEWRRQRCVRGEAAVGMYSAGTSAFDTSGRRAAGWLSTWP
jgi:hypothetical protein